PAVEYVIPFSTRTAGAGAAEFTPAPSPPPIPIAASSAATPARTILLPPATCLRAHPHILSPEPLQGRPEPTVSPTNRPSHVSREHVMKWAVVGVRRFVGLVFVVFGLNGFFRFIDLPTPPEPAYSFIGLLIQSKYLYAVKVLEVVGGLMLLSGRLVP